MDLFQTPREEVLLQIQQTLGVQTNNQETLVENLLVALEKKCVLLVSFFFLFFFFFFFFCDRQKATST